jgi:hypothetical protein
VSVYWWEKKSKCPKKKFSKCEEGKKKNGSVEFRVFGKKEMKEKFREKKSKCFFWMKILLSSCSLVGFYVNLQVKVTGKKKIPKCFSGECFRVRVAICLRKIKLKLMLETKMIAGVGLEPNHVRTPCCEPWLKFEVKDFRCSKKLKLKKMFGSWVTPLVGRHVVNEPKVGCYVMNELEIF